MPRVGNIRTFEAPALGITPSDAGVSSAAQAANRIGRTFDEVGSAATATGNQFARNLGSTVEAVGNHIADWAGKKNKADLAAASTKAMSEADQAWNVESAKAAKEGRADDPALIGKFNERLEQTFEKLRDAAWTDEGQRFAESRIAEMRNHFAVKTTADLSRLAAIDVNNKLDGILHSSSNTAMTDPTSVPTLLKMGSTSIAAIVDSSSNLKGVEAVKVSTELNRKLREGIVSAGVIGALRSSGNPEGEVDKWRAQYGDVLDARQWEALAGHGRQQVRAARADAAYADKVREDAAQHASDQRVDQYMKDLYSDDPQKAAAISARTIVNDPLLSRRDKDYMLVRLERTTKPETAAQRSAEATTQLLTRMQAPEGTADRITDVQPIYDAFKNGDLTRTDTDWLVKQFRDLRAPDGQRLSDAKGDLIKAVSGYISKNDPIKGNPDPDGELMKYRFIKDMDAKVDEYRKAGRDPYDLLDPTKPEFLGRPANVDRYGKSMQQAMADRVRRAAGKRATQVLDIGGAMSDPVDQGSRKTAPGPKKPGENPDAYLKRIGK